MRRKSPPLRVAWTFSLKLSAKTSGNPSTKRLVAYSHHFNQERRVPPSQPLGHFVGSSNTTIGVPPMNWLPGDMNPATGNTAYQISEEELL